MTYRELDEAANRLAHLMIAHGAAPGACVGLLCRGRSRRSWRSWRLRCHTHLRWSTRAPSEPKSSSRHCSKKCRRVDVVGVEARPHVLAQVGHHAFEQWAAENADRLAPHRDRVPAGGVHHDRQNHAARDERDGQHVDHRHHPRCGSTPARPTPGRRRTPPTCAPTPRWRAN